MKPSDASSARKKVAADGGPDCINLQVVRLFALSRCETSGTPQKVLEITPLALSTFTIRRTMAPLHPPSQSNTTVHTMIPSSRRPRLASLTMILSLQCWMSSGFVSVGSNRRQHPGSSPLSPQSSSSSASPTARHVWWYGGNAKHELEQETDSCELVAVRIEKTSANSRRIFGEITVDAPLLDVWAILTDYDRLSVHVPNLVESKIERPLSGGVMGDGQYQCRLFQKGAQKIIGFEFGASVTMDMKEIVMARLPTSSSTQHRLSDERKITFKCTDSFFFNEFDGEWKVKEGINDTGAPETVLSYVVDVRPRGPVPVAALEWRIREDVPTNLRAVKKAALAVGHSGVAATRMNQVPITSGLTFPRDSRVKVQWYKDETMAAYLTEN